jgi:CHAD domain-containing protein
MENGVSMSDPGRPQDLLVPVSARQPLLTSDVAGDAALRIILFETLAQVSANVPVVVEARASEGLHQFRVGLRRLRTALTLTDNAVLSACNARAKRFINLVGPARDLDVFLDELFHPAVAELGPRRGFDILQTGAIGARDAAWQTAVAEIDSLAFRQFADDAATAARSALWPETTTAGVMAPALLGKALARARKRGRQFRALDAPGRHRLRIALKKLRYTAEFFAALYPKAAVKQWLEPLKDLQDMLGHLNDVAQVRGAVARLLLEAADSASVQTELSHAAGLLQGFHQARSERYLGKTHKRWKQFRAAEPFWV